MTDTQQSACNISQQNWDEMEKFAQISGEFFARRAASMEGSLGSVREAVIRAFTEGYDVQAAVLAPRDES